MIWDEEDEKQFVVAMRNLYPEVSEADWGTYRATAMTLKGYRQLKQMDTDSDYERDIREDTVRRLLSSEGPLYQYLHPESNGVSFSRFKELVNETLSTNFTYVDLYDSQFAGWMFNAELNWEHADTLSGKDINIVSREKEVDPSFDSSA